MATLTLIMQATAGDDEIQLVRRHLPHADVLGVTREGRGLLLHVPGRASAADTHECEQQLLHAGASEWNWTAEHGGMRVRAYWHQRRSSRRYVAAAAVATAVFGLAYCWWYDVHLTQATARWLAALRR